MTNFGINSPEGQERIVGVAVSPGAAASTVLTADGAGGTSWAAGGGSQPVSGVAADAYLASLGLIGQPPFDVSLLLVNANIADFSVQMTGSLIGVVAGQVITDLALYVDVPGAGTAPAGAYLALYDTDGTRLAETANLASDAALTSAQGLVSVPLAAPYTVPTTKAIYACFLLTAQYGSTALIVGVAPSSNEAQAAGYALAGAHAACVQVTSATTPPASATFDTPPLLTGPFQPWVGLIGTNP